MAKKHKRDPPTPGVGSQPIPKGYVFQCVITLGYKAGETPPAKPRTRDVINYPR